MLCCIRAHRYAKQLCAGSLSQKGSRGVESRVNALSGPCADAVCHANCSAADEERILAARVCLGRVGHVDPACTLAPSVGPAGVPSRAATGAHGSIANQMAASPVVCCCLMQMIDPSALCAISLRRLSQYYVCKEARSEQMAGHRGLLWKDGLPEWSSIGSSCCSSFSSSFSSPMRGSSSPLLSSAAV